MGFANTKAIFPNRALQWCTRALALEYTQTHTQWRRGKSTKNTRQKQTHKYTALIQLAETLCSARGFYIHSDRHCSPNWWWENVYYSSEWENVGGALNHTQNVRRMLKTLRIHTENSECVFALLTRCVGEWSSAVCACVFWFVCFVLFMHGSELGTFRTNRTPYSFTWLE